MALFLLAGCSTGVNYYKGKGPALDLQAYLQGPIEGSGIVKDWRGRITKQFDFIAEASWKGTVGTLDEHMIYYDGEKDHRIWTIKKINDNLYEGTTPDVIGKAVIRVEGNAMNWQYTMDVKVDNSTYRINFDDWMYLMHDGVLINENKFKKFGLNVGSLTLFMKKKDREEKKSEAK
jgi:hypothetical protein